MTTLLKKILILTAVFIFIIIKSEGQNSWDNFTFNIDTIQVRMKIPGSDTLIHIKCSVFTSAIDSISKLYIKIGSVENGNDIVDKNIIINGNNIMEPNMSMLKRGNTIILLLGYYLTYKYFYEIKLENFNGVISSPVTFHP